MDTLPYAVQSAFPLLFLVVPAAGALVSCRRRAPERRPAEIWQRWWVIGALGCGSLWMTLSFLTMPGAMAETIGFARTPFQFEIAFANLGLAVLGFRAASASPRERLTVGLSAAAFLWGAVVGHLDQWFAHGDHAPGNTGGVLLYDLLIPAVVIAMALRDMRQASALRSGAAVPAA
ncbi:DUF6790 family protein [Streptomyces sp. NPDC002514]|uniref:DUF6790 family protein n=1 Tax=Streptomyces sp. NPDC001270 TaxID=3364554 RepID=UPI0036A46AFD